MPHDFLTNGIVDLIIIDDNVRFVVHRSILERSPYFASLLRAGINEVGVADVSSSVASDIITHLYSSTVTDPFVDRPATLPAKIAIAETFIVAERWGIPEMMAMAMSALSAIVLGHRDQLQFWRFVYAHTTPTSAIRIPNTKGLSVGDLVQGVGGALEDADRDLLHDLLLLSVAE